MEYPDFEAMVQIESGTVKGEMPRRALKLLFEWMDLHTEELMQNWHASQSQEPLKRIEPLK